MDAAQVSGPSLLHLLLIADGTWQPQRVPILRWRDAAVADRAALRTFECTERVKRLGRTVYPRPWERQAETAIRRANPMCDARSAVLLGEDAQGLSAVAAAGYDQTYGDYVVEVIAVANRHRRRGGAVALEAMDEALQWITHRADADGRTQFAAVADLDVRNDAARHLLMRANFRPLVRPDPQSEVWIYDSAELPFGS